MKNCLDSMRSTFVQLIRNILEEHTSIKVNLEQFALYCLKNIETTDIKSFNTENIVITQGSNLEAVFEKFINIITTQASEFEEKDSGKIIFFKFSFFLKLI